MQFKYFVHSISKPTIMKIFLTVLSFIFLITNCYSQNSSYENEIKHFQHKLNAQYASLKESPLTKEDLKTFKTLDFFDIDENYCVKDTLELTPDAPFLEMKTSTERLPLYRKYGIAHFILNGKKCELSIYQSSDLKTYTNNLFLPYNDISNGVTTYGGGRFIDLETPTNGSTTIVIDFNKSYNPYCAYNHKYSCPIPPSENNLAISILAGVKAFNKKH